MQPHWQGCRVFVGQAPGIAKLTSRRGVPEAGSSAFDDRGGMVLVVLQSLLWRFYVLLSGVMTIRETGDDIVTMRRGDEQSSIQ